MKVLCLASSDRPELYNLFHPSFQAYCAKWGISYKLYPITPNLGRAQSWNKVYLLNQLLQENEYDVFWWVDDDMVLTNYDIDIRAIINAYPDAPILVQKDIDNFFVFNCGCMIIRNCDESRRVFRMVWDEADPKSLVHCNWEQDVMVRLYRQNKIRNAIQLLEWKQLQGFVRTYSLPQGLAWAPGDFIAHFTGEPIEKRLALYQQLLPSFPSPLV
jgi:hypothetical protein